MAISRRFCSRKGRKGRRASRLLPRRNGSGKFIKSASSYKCRGMDTHVGKRGGVYCRKRSCGGSSYKVYLK